MLSLNNAIYPLYILEHQQISSLGHCKKLFSIHVKTLFPSRYILYLAISALYFYNVQLISSPINYWREKARSPFNCCLGEMGH